MNFLFIINIFSYRLIDVDELLSLRLKHSVKHVCPYSLIGVQLGSDPVTMKDIA